MTNISNKFSENFGGGGGQWLPLKIHSKAITVGSYKKYGRVELNGIAEFTHICLCM